MEFFIRKEGDGEVVLKLC